MDATNAGKEETPCNDFDETLDLEKKLSKQFEEVLKLIQEDAFWNNVGEGIEKTYPEIKKLLKERMKDLEKRDCEIVVAGETNAGKSTLINKLIGHDALTTGILETTGTIYRVMHSEKMRVNAYHIGWPEPNELSFNSVGELHKELENMDKEDNLVSQVDVLLPFSKIQNGNVTIVDTPGISDSIEYRTMLEEYIPKAVAFIIVIDVSRAGGLHGNMVSSVLSTIERSAATKQCFDLKDTLFVRNKWDKFLEEDLDLVKTELTHQMKTKWPWVRESQIFDLSLGKAFRDDFSENNSQFKQFDDAIHELIKRKENTRIQTHAKYLLGVILEASNVLSEALTAIHKQMDGNDFTFQQCKEFIPKTEEAIRTVRETLQKEINKTMEETAEACYDFMSTDAGKDMILNSPGRPPILQRGRFDVNFEINELVRQYVNRFLRSSDVFKKFKGIRGEIVSFYHNTSLELSKMENEWTYDQGSKVSVCEALETSPLCLPDFTIVCVSLSWNNYLIPFLTNDRKQTLIDETYDHYLCIIRSSICNHLRSSYGIVIQDLIDKVTKDLIPKRINYLKKIIDQCQGAQEKYLRKQKLERLALDVKRLQETTTELQRSIEYMTQVEEANNGML